MQRRWPFAFAVLVPGAALACSTIFGFQDLTLLDGGTGDGGVEAQGVEAALDGPAIDAGSEAASGGGCASAVPPSAPTTDDTPDAGDGGVDLYFAIDTLDLGQSAPGQFDPNDALGFDLDGVCTCIDDGGPSCNGASPVCDTPGGRDEGANAMLAALGGADNGLSQASLQQRLSSGDFGLVLHVYGYNGQANDQSVDVEVFPSPGSESVPDGGGTTVWDVTAGSVIGGTAGAWVSKYQDVGAYVNDHVLVAHLPMFALLVLPDTGGNMNPITFNLGHIVVQATLTETGGTWSMRGQVGARWATSDALYSLHTLADTSGDSICGSELLYQTIQGVICSGADIASNPADDDHGKPCDALSIGLGFTASPALLGNAYDPPVVPGDCPDGWAPACP